MKKVQFEVEAKKYFEVDPKLLERVQNDDMVLVTIDFENKYAEYIWYRNDESPANFPSEPDDFEGVVRLWEELGRPGSEPNIIIMKENFPAAGEAYIIGEQMGRYFFAWGSVYPFVNDLPEKDVMGQSGIQWFDSKEEAIKAAEIREKFDYLFRLSD